MSMKKKRNVYIVGNWKMNPVTPEEAKTLYTKINKASQGAKKVHTIVCPPSIHIPLFAKVTKKYARLGSQDAFFEQEGSFTGNVSPLMFKNAGVEYVIVGHSERRALGETDEIVSKKVRAVLASGLRPIVCVGERERDSAGAYLTFIHNQVLKSVEGVDALSLSKIIFAYEPVWAIGKKYTDVMKPSDVHEMSLYIKKTLSRLYPKDEALAVPVLYGGSVNFENAQPILLDGEVAGLLIGRQSLDAVEFSKIVAYANQLD